MHTTPSRPNGRRFARGRLLVAPVAVLAVVALGACTRSPGTGGGSTTTAPSPPSGGGTQTVTATIKVSGTFDGQGRTYRGGGSLGGGYSEGKPPIFELAPGSTVRNLTIGVPASDGIHCLGTCRIENVVWTDVLDDAATLKGSSPTDVMTISGGSAHHAPNKVFQHNGPGKVIIENFTVEDFGKLYRSCGNCPVQPPRSVEIRHVTAIGPGATLAGINQNFGDSATISDVTIKGDPNRRIAICQKYIGNRSELPPQQATPFTGPGGGCNYSASTITYG